VPDVERLLGELGTSSLNELRAGLETLARAVSSPRHVYAIESSQIDLPGRQVPVRRYRPGPGSHPTLLWFHGGGYVTGSLDAIDPTCREIAMRAAVDVVSVGYRLAPEHRYPAALEDALLAAEHLRPDAVGGDSAGGGLAAAVAQRRPGLHAQVLLCPWLDGTLTLPSVRAQSAPDGLNESSLRAFMALYCDDPTDPGVSPLRATDLGPAPPAILVLGGLDPLRDDGAHYGQRLRQAGIHVDLRCWDDQAHGFPGMTTVTPAAAESLQWAADRLRDLLAVPG
jgi:acetyl esterase